MGIIEKFAALKEEALPKSGFNVVAVDDYDLDSPPTVVAHSDSREEAERICIARQKQNPGMNYYVYGADS